MYTLELTKPDGRKLWLYSNEPIDPSLKAPVPKSNPTTVNPHLRWHPLRGEWVAYATHRQNRTFLPPKEYNPLAPSLRDDFPTELPAGKYDVAVFENLFPTLTATAHSPPEFFVPTRPAHGACEVVVFSQNPETSLTELPLKNIELILEVWQRRYQTLAEQETVKYVLPFENKGIEMGVTLNHPHGQIYAYPFIPPVPEKEMRENKAHFLAQGRSLLETLVADEMRDQTRMLFQGESIVAFVPVCARYPYETWITSKSRRGSLADLSGAEKKELARALKTVLLKYQGLWNRPFPYLMLVYQAPTDGVYRPEAHFHIEFMPPYRSENKLKFLAGTELGAGLFANDSLPEERAADLKDVEVHID